MSNHSSISETMPRRVVVASNNAHKIAEFRSILQPYAIEVLSPADLQLSLEVPETGETFAENATLKAEAFRDATGLTAVADDSGLVVDALDGRPGVYSARYGGPGLDDAGRVHLLLRELAGVPPDRRTARFVAAIAVAAPGEPVQVVEGSVEGIIAPAPAGAGGFGYDPVFFYPAAGKTFAEMARREKDAVSHRGRALRAAVPLLIGLRGLY